MGIGTGGRVIRRIGGMIGSFRMIRGFEVGAEGLQKGA